MGSILYIYDVKNLKTMQETLTEFQFFSIAHLLHKYNTVESLTGIKSIANAIVDITNLVKDGTYYSIFTENYLRTLSGKFDNIHFSLQTDCLDTFKDRYPYFFNEDEINIEFNTVVNKDIISGKVIAIHMPLDLYAYKNQATIKKLYEDGKVISLSNLVEGCGGFVFEYNLENISYTIIEKGIKYIDLSSIVKTLKLRGDLVFQFEILIHHLASANNVNYSIENSLLNETITTFPLVFLDGQNMDDYIDEVESNNGEAQRVDVDKVSLFIDQISEKLKGHIAFKNDFKHNLLKFSFLNRMYERKILSVLLCGDSGIGKTEFAKITSNIMYPHEPLIKINLGNYSTDGVLNSLIGSPLGYIGSEEGGELINKISTSKTKIILIDEFEKATPSV